MIFKYLRRFACRCHMNPYRSQVLLWVCASANPFTGCPVQIMVKPPPAGQRTSIVTRTLNNLLLMLFGVTSISLSPKNLARLSPALRYTTSPLRFCRPPPDFSSPPLADRTMARTEGACKKTGGSGCEVPLHATGVNEKLGGMSSGH